MKEWDRKEKDKTNDTFEDVIHRISLDIVYDSELTPYLVRGALAKFKPRIYGIMLLLFGGMSDNFIKEIMNKILDERKTSDNINSKELAK